MKMMLSVLSAERYLPMMRMGFGYVAMAVIVRLTSVVRLFPVKKLCLNSIFSELYSVTVTFAIFSYSSCICFEDFVMSCA